MRGDTHSSWEDLLAAERHLQALEGVSKGCPHCRAAPWGVSEAATSPVLSQTPRGRAVALGIVLSAPETPHGASLHWGPRRNRKITRTSPAPAALGRSCGRACRCQYSFAIPGTSDFDWPCGKLPP